VRIFQGSSRLTIDSGALSLLAPMKETLMLSKTSIKRKEKHFVNCITVIKYVKTPQG
jgi:hypothetical protein